MKTESVFIKLCPQYLLASPWVTGDIYSGPGEVVAYLEPRGMRENEKHTWPLAFSENTGLA